MKRRIIILITAAGACICVGLFSCNGGKAEPSHMVSTPEELKQQSREILASYLDAMPGGADSTWVIHHPELVRGLYEQRGQELLWSSAQQWLPGADTLSRLAREARLLGLFPEDYHAAQIDSIMARIRNDSLLKGAGRDARLWSEADLMLTDAYVGMLQDIRLGKIPNDSISLNRDSVMAPVFFSGQLDLLRQTGAFARIIDSLEPNHWGYRQLKKAIPAFLETAAFRSFTRVPARNKPGFSTALQKRLYEGGYIAFDSVAADSIQLAQAVKKFQQEKNITVDGLAGEGTIRMLNMDDGEKFMRIAISMDKYKKMPAEMPEKYIWVNTAANLLDVVEDETVVFSSRVITGKPKTRTPLLNSAVSVLITYPQWVPPPSIVNKEILPAVKKNPGYLSRKGFSLLDKEGNEVDPYTVDWSKYSKGLPYRIVQGSGDANALGILKFHFDNKYSVYLHDTNQRYLFGNAMRSLSHGCVRVQEWQRLARFILRNDSLNASGSYRMGDSLQTWLVRKEKHHIPVKARMPVYIRYFTCEARDGKVVFYDDVYGEDRFIREKYYAGK